MEWNLPMFHANLIPYYQAFEMCCKSNFNMSYESLTGYQAWQKLHNLKKTDPEFGD